MLGIDCSEKPLLAKKQEFRCGSQILIQSELLSHSSNSSWVISDRILPGVGALMPRIRCLKGGGQDLRQLDASSFGLANGRQMLAFHLKRRRGPHRDLPGLASQSIQQSTDCPSLHANASHFGSGARIFRA
ncbi:hypothetical protein VNO77_46178 [Canavalia gladiata]|uniref:Uncharacterized protein n=1 Tax=Canavalia gladiata TaxID=3824 RepID=A0AAN9JHN3_CANGL